ncbi:MAG: SDR family oxidoreductase, partial [Actinomycetales bacterium]
MRILVTGANGQLGSDLMLLLADRPEDVGLGLDLPEIDITDPASVGAALDSFAPDAVVNCAAWTAVDLAEEREADALRVNGEGPAVWAEACAERGPWMVQLSTDYVFDGYASQPYPEDAATEPQSAYGRTKLAGELAVRQVMPDTSYLVRTAWLYGVRGQN